MPASEPCGRFYRWGIPSHAEAAERLPQAWQSSPGRVACEEWTRHPKLSCDANTLAEMLRGGRSLAHVLWTQLAAGRAVHSEAALLRARCEQLRAEFETLAEQWRQDTQHLSVISKAVSHPAYFRIMGMGDAVVPLLLEALRDRPAHWFAALRATANVDPSPVNANPAEAREAWLRWGRDSGLID